MEEFHKITARQETDLLKISLYNFTEKNFHPTTGYVAQTNV